LKLGVIGLPNVGKSTLFNALTQSGAESANYPFCTIEPNVGIVAVPDERLTVLAAMNKSQKVIPASIEFVDIAGLVKGASKGEGLGNKFLSHIREVDAVVHTVRCFDDANIIHVNGKTDPIDDIEIVNLELIFADLETISKRIDKTKNAAKGGDKKYLAELEILNKINDALTSGKSVSSAGFSSEEKEFVKSLFLLTSKPVLYACNIKESDIPNIESLESIKKVRELAAKEGSEVLVVCAKVEDELMQLEPDEREMFLRELGLNKSGLDRLIAASYNLLGLISFLTTGEKETRAWTIKKGMKAPQAAGRIHTDFEKGFIRAEVVSYENLVEAGSLAAAKEKGKVRSEGKEYVFQDGDVVIFRFNV
jgi:GTP-binding protein YchF